jgi:hypothetical protein
MHVSSDQRSEKPWIVHCEVYFQGVLLGQVTEVNEELGYAVRCVTENGRIVVDEKGIPTTETLFGEVSITMRSGAPAWALELYNKERQQ